MIKGEAACRDMHGFADWKKWKQERLNATTNP